MSADRGSYEELRSLGRLLDERVDAVTAREALNRAAVSPELPGAPRRRVPVIVAAALVVLAVVAFGLVAVIRDDRASIDTAGQVTNLDPGQCAALPAAPIAGRYGATGVWTGREMIVWGGQSSGRALGDGAAYNPATGSWRTLAPAPIAPRYAHIAVWTGDEMIVWGGNDRQRGLADGAAYDPATDTWRTIPAAPKTGTSYVAYAWSGDELIVAAGSTSSGGGYRAVQDAAAYDPRVGVWRALPDSPIGDSGFFPQAVWTGSRFVMVGDGLRAPRSPGGEVDDAARIAAYDPAADAWIPVTGVDLAGVPTGGSGYAAPSPRLVWDGQAVLVLNGSMFSSYAVDPATLVGREIQRAPGEAYTAGAPTWTGSDVVFWWNGAVTAYDPSTDRWSGAPGTDFESPAPETVVWTGQEILTWGGSISRGILHPVGVDAGVAYRPDDLATGCPLRSEQIAAARDTPPGPRAEPGADWPTIENETAGVAMQVPPEWQSLSVVVGGDEPPELLAAGNAPRPSGLALSKCPAEPLTGVPVLVSVAEITDSSVAPDDWRREFVVDRPDDFGALGGVGGTCEASVSRTESVPIATIDSWYFRDHGREFVATIVTGLDATEAELDEAIAVLNSLRVQDKQPVPTVQLSAADEAAIRQAFDAWLTESPRSKAAPFIEDFDSIAAAVAAAEAGAPPDRVDHTGTVDAIEPIDRNTARVTYSIIDDGITLLGGRQGTAVKVNGKWLVSRDTACALIALGGVGTCPAR